MVTPFNQSLSPEAQQLNEALGRIFAQVREALKPSAEAFAKLGEPRYTMAEIRAALVECGCWRVQEAMQRELEAGRARAAKL